MCATVALTPYACDLTEDRNEIYCRLLNSQCLGLCTVFLIFEPRVDYFVFDDFLPGGPLGWCHYVPGVFRFSCDNTLAL